MNPLNMRIIRKKNETETFLRQLIEEINLIKDNLTSGNDQENELIRLNEKNQELQKLHELEIKGYIRSRAEYIEGGEKNTKYFANLEKKKRSDAKTLHKLKTDMVEITDRKEILNEVRSFYEKMYTEQIVDEDKMNQMINNISIKLNVEEKMI